MSEWTPQTIRRAAIDLLARREYSSYELKTKLLQRCSSSTKQSFRKSTGLHSKGPLSKTSQSRASLSREAQDAHHQDIDSQNTDSQKTASFNQEPLGSNAEELATAAELIEQVLLELQQENLQSDERFVESFINGRKAKGHGPQRIRYDLNQKHVAAQLIEEYMEAQADQWPGLAEKVYLKKFGALAPRDYKEKARRLRFMQQRGFPVWTFEALLD